MPARRLGVLDLEDRVPKWVRVLFGIYVTLALSGSVAVLFWEFAIR